jgi:hypothetical protein
LYFNLKWTAWPTVLEKGEIFLFISAETEPEYYLQ